MNSKFLNPVQWRAWNEIGRITNKIMTTGEQKQLTDAEIDVINVALARALELMKTVDKMLNEASKRRLHALKRS